MLSLGLLPGADGAPHGCGRGFAWAGGTALRGRGFNKGGASWAGEIMEEWDNNGI